MDIEHVLLVGRLVEPLAERKVTPLVKPVRVDVQPPWGGKPLYHPGRGAYRWTPGNKPLSLPILF